MENVVPVSTTVNPVTHKAEVDVNNASIKESWTPFVTAIGSLSKKVPITMSIKNPVTNTREGVNAFVILRFIAVNLLYLRNLTKTPSS